MALLFDVIRLVQVFLSLVCGLTLNSYIISVYVQQWRKRQALNVCDQVIILLAVTGIIFQCSFSSEVLEYYFGRRGVIKALFIFHFFLMYESFWNTAWLSIYYCLKLVKCSHCIVLQLKRRMSSSMTPILAASLVGLIIITLPVPWTLRAQYMNKTSAHSVIGHYFAMDVRYIPIFMAFGSFLPFLLSFICIGLSVKSLLSHVLKIHKNSSQFSSSPQLAGHLRAVRTMILQVLLCLTLYAAVLGLLLLPSVLGMAEKLFCFIIMTSYPSAQAMILIQGNPKLRSGLPRIQPRAARNISVDSS